MRSPFALLVALLAGCDGSYVTAARDGNVQLSVVNNLVAPVSIAIDGVPHVGLFGGTSMGITVSTTAQWLTWTSAKPTDESGVPIPDGIDSVRIAISGINQTLEINNIIHDQAYFTARIFNSTTARVSIGLFDGATVSCVSTLPAAPPGGHVYTQTGYYALLSATELRAYRDPASCTGPFVAWPTSVLRTFEPKSGALILFLDEAP